MAESSNLRNVELVEDEANILLLRYLDLEFVDDVTDYQCGRCDRVVIKHYISNCGHHFCLNCKKILEDGGPKHKWRCPVCQQFITHVDHQDMKLAEQINALRVRCPNGKYGCPFISSINAMPEHLNECRMTKEAALPVMYKGTNTMQAILDEISKMNKKIDMLSEGMNVVTDMIIQLDKVDNQNKKYVEMAVDDLKRRVQGVQSELHVTTDRMQNELITIHENKDGRNSYVADQMKIIQTDFETTKAEVNVKMKFMIEMWDQKEDRFNQKWIHVKTEMENSIATETALRLDESEKLKSTMNLNLKQQMDQLKSQLKIVIEDNDTNTKVLNQAFEEKFNKVTEKMTTHENTHNAIEEQFKADINKIKTEFDDTKNKQKVQMEIINNCNELMSKLKLNEDEINSKIKQNQHKIYELEQNRKRMEDYNKLHKIHKVISNQQLLLSQSLVYSWTIKGIKEKMKNGIFESESAVFTLNGYHFRAKAKFKIIDYGYVDMFLCFVDDKNTKRPIEFNLIPTVTFIIRDQIENKKGLIGTCNTDYRKHFEYNKYYYSNYYNSLPHSKTLMRSPYFINDTIVIDIYVESPSVAQLSHPTNGQITYYINNYNMNKALQKEDPLYSQYSPYYYTSPTGYRIQIQMYLNGRDDFKGKGLTSFIHFLSGEFDSSLTSTFKYRATITIFNQSDPNKHLVKSVQQDKKDSNYYRIDIAPHSEIENGGFLLNDTLIYKVDIEIM